MSLTHLDRLEAEALHVMREVAAEAERPVLPYPASKDRSVLLHQALKAFFPAAPPSLLLRVRRAARGGVDAGARSASFRHRDRRLDAVDEPPNPAADRIVDPLEQRARGE